MVYVFISWCWIAISSFLWGFAFTKLLNKINCYEKRTIDSVLMLGLCFLTVYAQFFSLFYKVGALATALLLMINFLILLYLRKEIWAQLIHWLSVPKILVRILILITCLVFILVISSTNIQHYDTYLYHAQSIKWIEEYGIVKGLGNLHHRFAYNSSLFPLQALFSLEFLMGNSLHSVNGFVTFLMLSYSLCTMKFFQKKRLFVSDFLRLALIVFLSQNCNVISSPGSDIFALGLVGYILIKWMDLEEIEERNNTPYVMLSLLGVYAVSLKLSAAMIVLLALMPLLNLILKRQWKVIIIYIFLGIIIISPFLIRNIIISGYLLYPYPELDLFQVDWKMPKYTALFDRYEIQAWGRGLNDVYRFNATLSEWFPTWINSLGVVMQIIFYLNLILFIPSFIYGIYKGITEKDWNFLLMIVTMISCFVLWFFGAPSQRFGSIFLIMFSAFILGKSFYVSLKIRSRMFCLVPFT